MNAPRRAALSFIFITVVLDVLSLGVTIPVLPKLVATFFKGDVAAAAPYYGLFATVWAMMQFIVAPIMGALSDRIGRWPVVGGGWILYALVYIGFAMIGPGQAIALWPLFAVYGIYQAMAQGATKALVAEHSPKNQRGAALGFFYMASGFATIGGNLIAGLLWDRVSPAAAFYTGGGLALLSALAIPFVIRTSKRSTLNT